MSLASVCKTSELFDIISENLNDQRPFSVVFNKKGSCEKINNKVKTEWISFANMEMNETREMQLYISNPPSNMISNPRMEGLTIQMNKFLEDQCIKMVYHQSITEMPNFFFRFIFPLITLSFIHFQLIEWSKKSSVVGSFFLCFALLLVFCYELVYFTLVHPKKKSC